MIRHAEMTDLPRILEIYEIARQFMRKNGNMKQWSDGYPYPDLLEKDIQEEKLFVEEFEGKISGVFWFWVGPDPTYAQIEGKWNSDGPYGTIHRIAGDGSHPGLLARAVEFCSQFIGTLRADTHSDNMPMQGALKKNGFEYCGIIHLANGDPRIAFQRG